MPKQAPEPPVYGMPVVLSAAVPDGEVWICYGEGDALPLRVILNPDQYRRVAIEDQRRKNSDAPSEA